MTRVIGFGILALAAAIAPGQTTAQEESAVAVPSGMPVTFYDSLWDSASSTERFRFLAPRIGGDMPMDFAAVSPDMQHLCDSFALPRLGGRDKLPALIVISLMAEPVAFGDPAPGIPQYFEAYSPKGGICAWEAF
ncbi:DUF6497 family protein [Alloyangia pacifica]|uniref:DUF6497 family protein n=1 Tax=Alloyangia pacifica TaxID=311180 RepID=UPI001CD305EB|nr:DUF6497 family protein [Alloyangia pacifica]MCA0997633.1 DUF6497 family protein [Alloyangia pacifica]